MARQTKLMCSYHRSGCSIWGEKLCSIGQWWLLVHLLNIERCHRCGQLLVNLPNWIQKHFLSSKYLFCLYDVRLALSTPLLIYIWFLLTIQSSCPRIKSKNFFTWYSSYISSLLCWNLPQVLGFWTKLFSSRVFEEVLSHYANTFWPWILSLYP